MISTVRMCDRVKAALERERRGRIRWMDRTLVARRANRRLRERITKMRERLGEARELGRVAARELREFRRRQRRLPL